MSCPPRPWSVSFSLLDSDYFSCHEFVQYVVLKQSHDSDLKSETR